MRDAAVHLPVPGRDLREVRVIVKGGFLQKSTLFYLRNIRGRTNMKTQHRSAYFAGEYQLAMGGIIAARNMIPYALMDKTGELPNEFVVKRQQRNAPVSCAAFLSIRSDICVLPCALFGGAFTDPLVSQGDAARYGEVITCMAEKLFFDC